MDGSDCSIEKVFEAHRISHHPRKHTITPYNCSDAGLTATAAAAAVAHNESAWHILFSARQQHVPSSDGSSAYNRRPFCSTAAAAVLAMATLNKLERHNRDDEGDEGSSRQTNTLLAEKARQRRVLEHSKQLDADRPPRTREQDTHEEAVYNGLSPALLPRINPPPERAQKQNQKLRIRSD